MGFVPKLDNRDSNDLLKQVKQLAKEYTPEWNFDEFSQDFGIVFAKIFCNMQESTISKYNKMVYNYYLVFLNMLGTKIRPATPASGMVIVNASNNSNGTFIKKGTAMFANANTADGTVVYETLDSLFAVSTRINSIMFTDGALDIISYMYKFDEKAENPDETEKVGPLRIFDNVTYKNLQAHEIYFGDNMIFNMSKPDITFLFYNKLSTKAQQMLPHIFGDKKNVVWQYYNQKEWKDVKDVEIVDGGICLRLDSPVHTTKVLDQESRYIRCVFKKLPKEEIILTQVKYLTKSDVLTADKLYSDNSELMPTDFYPFEENYNMYSIFSFSCAEAFTKKGSKIKIEAEIQFTKIKIDTNNLNIPGRKYKQIMTEIDFADMEPEDIKIERVIWEYWNGIGWARLDTGEDGENFFNLKSAEKGNAPQNDDNKLGFDDLYLGDEEVLPLKDKPNSDNNKNKNQKQYKPKIRNLEFICPEDFAQTMVGSGEGYFVRARITKMKNQFNFFSNHITPYIHKISVSYDYEGRAHQCNELIVKSNVKTHRLDISNNYPVKIVEKTLEDNPMMYLCLTKPLAEGTIRMFVNIEEGIHRFNPTIKWEYCADDFKGGYVWKHIDIMDLTDDFSHSETITMIGKKDFKKIELFGETGYFIRAVNPDNKYRDSKTLSSRPIINDIKFNAVKIEQRESRPPEFFSIEPDEENKVCKLSHSNSSNVEVWVDETGKLSTKEQERFVKSKDLSEVIYDDLGQIERIWIKWSAVPRLACTGLKDRVYEIDYSKGEITFGNGKNGRIPPAQYSESIRINYFVCHGNLGNVPEKSVKDFLINVPKVEGVYNPSPILGGIEMETIDNASRRMFGYVSGGNRLVTLSDFEDSICFNDRNIYKVKCLAHVDEESEPSIGVTSIAVLPKVYMQGYDKFQGIKKNIWNFIDPKAPATLARSTKLRIFEVRYVETSVHLDVIIDDFNHYQIVHSGIREKLKIFLDPISGNFSRKGWNIGEFPQKEFIYNYIKSVKHIKWIKKINIFTAVVTREGKKEVEFEQIKKQHFTVPVFGDPIINISTQ